MAKHKCADCGRAAKATFKYCWGCEKKMRQLMAATGYLQDVSWIKEEERKAVANSLGTRSNKQQSRVHSETVVARQLCGELMKSGSKKGK